MNVQAEKCRLHYNCANYQKNERDSRKETVSKNCPIIKKEYFVDK